ncbi:MAG: hypothetical protein A2Z14_00500 [Chloroflexi bacterium RBG_16_48_8]|nr:MAG: hypothetical protein A2Z14_00500 [Chloroflexi bacterium RBG_16_48_8]
MAVCLSDWPGFTVAVCQIILANHRDTTPNETVPEGSSRAEKETPQETSSACASKKHHLP